MSAVQQDIAIKTHRTIPAAQDGLRMHLMPCRVECDGVRGAGVQGEGCAAARVSSYFDPVIRDTNDTITASGEQLSVHGATFRGRMLRGVEVKVPSGYQGTVLHETSPSHGNEGREFEVKGRFSQFHYWNLQTSPTGDDKLLQAMKWTQLARGLHTPLPLAPDDTQAEKK